MPSNMIRTLMYHISYVQAIIFIVTTPSNAIQPDKNSHVSIIFIIRHLMPSNLIRTLMYHISYVQTIIFIVTTPCNAIQHDKNSHVSYIIRASNYIQCHYAI